MHRQRAYVGGGLCPGTALVFVCLAVVPLPPRSNALMMIGCCLVGGCEGGCPVVGGKAPEVKDPTYVNIHVVIM